MPADARRRMREFRLMTCPSAWYPVALSNGLEPGRSAGTRVFDRELCIWRDADGVAHAWEDRCPHRMAPLSKGRYRGGIVECGYHGMQFVADGSCVAIPGQDVIPARARVRRPKPAESPRLGRAGRPDGQYAD